jgi:hypothetical protein
MRRDAVNVIASCLMRITHTRLWSQFQKHFFELVHAAAANRYDHAGANEIEEKFILLTYSSSEEKHHARWKT